MTRRAPARHHAVEQPRALTDHEFQRFQELIEAHSGIHLVEGKQAMLMGRLTRRLRELGLMRYRDYYDLVLQSEEELTRMLDSVTTNETSFFREPRQFHFLEERVFPVWREEGERGARSRSLRVWSAACATGEEPYTIGMVLLTHFPPSAGWHVEVLASDLSTRALKKAREAVFPLERSKDIPEPLLKRFMLKGTRSQEGLMKASPELRAVVHFRRLNLTLSDFGNLGLFDLVFCRNVLIYFTSTMREHVVQRLVDHLQPRGLLLLGHAENVARLTSQVASMAPNIYGRRDTMPLEPRANAR